MSEPKEPTDLSDHRVRDTEPPAPPVQSDLLKNMVADLVVTMIADRIRLQSVAVERAALRYEQDDQRAALQAVARKLLRSEERLRAIVSPHPMRASK